MDSYQEEKIAADKRYEVLEDIRAFKIIDYITLSMGRRDEDNKVIPLEPAKIFPSLKDLPVIESVNEEEEIDPKQTFEQFKAINAPRMRRIRAPRVDKISSKHNNGA